MGQLVRNAAGFFQRLDQALRPRQDDIVHFGKKCLRAAPDPAFIAQLVHRLAHFL
jgi:hypothetical protein